jgi:hypothetical protein
MTLLTPQKNNPKMAAGWHLPYEACILHLAPFNLSGYQMCPFASGSLEDKTGCVHACLYTAGHGGIGGVNGTCQKARVRKTRWFHEERDAFLAQLCKEIHLLEKRAAKKGRIPAVRLNGTSDWPWEITPVFFHGFRYDHIFERFPNVQFYDYTKIPHRITSAAVMSIPNYHLTFSLSESNDRHAIAALERGVNVAVVLRLGKKDPMPSTFSGYPCIDGTLHDFRFLDAPIGGIVGLRPKGKALKDTSGFVHALDYQLDASRKPMLAIQSLSRKQEMLTGVNTAAA